MGIDVCVYFKSKKTAEEFNHYGFGDGLGKIKELKKGPYGDELIEKGATHCIETGCRYYSEGYARGPWPSILKVLLKLKNSDKVEKVWYGGDTWFPDFGELTDEFLIETTKYYLESGHKEYHWSKGKSYL